MFDIDIRCDKKAGNLYYIAHAEDMEQGGVRKWLINTFAVNNLINESHTLKRRILFEEIPSGQRFLTPIIEAMRDERTVEICYRSFGAEQARTSSSNLTASRYSDSDGTSLPVVRAMNGFESTGLTGSRSCK